MSLHFPFAFPFFCILKCEAQHSVREISLRHPLRREAGGFRFLYPGEKHGMRYLPHPRMTLDRHSMNERASLLVFRPVGSLTSLGTIAPDASASGTPPADQEPRFGQVTSLATVGTDSTPQPWPVLPYTGPARHEFQHLFVRPVLFGTVVLSALHILIKVFFVRIVCGDCIP